MRVKFLTTAIVLCFSYSYAQQLSVDETIDYIKNVPTKYSIFNERETVQSFDLTISELGIVKLRKFSFYPNATTKYRAETISFDFKYKINVSVDAIMTIAPIHFYSPTKEVIEENDGQYNSIKDHVWFNLNLSLEGNQKFVNALRYLLNIIKNDEKYNKLDSDPFSNDQFFRNSVVVDNTTQKTDALVFKTIGNLAIINVNLSGHPSDMIIDSGASDLSISQSTERELIDKGLIKRENYIESGLYKLADGSIVTARRVKIPFVKIGAYTVKDIECGISPTGDVQLLGKSFLNRFSKWSIDNVNNKLVLEK